MTNQFEDKIAKELELIPDTSDITGPETIICDKPDYYFQLKLAPAAASAKQNSHLTEYHNLQSKSITIEDYQTWLEQYNTKKEELANLQIQLANIQDNKKRLLTEKQIKEESIERIKRKIETSETNDIQTQLDSYKTESQKLDTKKQKLTHKIDQSIEGKIDTEYIWVWAIFSIFVPPAALMPVFACLVLVDLGSLIPFFALPVMAIAEIAFTEYMLAPFRRITNKIRKKKIKKINQTQHKQNQKMLETSKNLHLLLESNPEAINQLQELKSELEKNIERITDINQEIQVQDTNTNECQNQINNIKQEIDRLFYTLSAAETELLLQGQNIETILDEEQMVKALGEYPKGGK